LVTAKIQSLPIAADGRMIVIICCLYKRLSAGRFTTFGYGLTRPIADNGTEEGRALNRRVSIKATFHE